MTSITPGNPSRVLLRVVQVLAAAMMTVGGTLAWWWLVGDQSTMGPRLLTHRPPIPRLESFPAEIEARNAQLPADFVWQPFDISLETERTVGLVGLAAFAVGILVLLATRRTFRRAWWWIIAAPVVAGMTLAWSHRIMTAGVGGANFGAGIVSFLVLPALLVGLSVAASFAYRLLRNPYSHRGLPLPPDA